MLLRVLKEGASTALSEGKKKYDKLRSRSDKEMPFGIKIGDYIDFDNLFLQKTCLEEAFHYEDDDPETDHSYLDLHCGLPDDKKKVVAISKSEWDGYLYYWFHFEDDHYLEIIANREKPLLPIEGGIRYYSFGEEIIPEGDEEELYLPNYERNNVWWIGNQFFYLPGQDIDEDGVWTQFAYARMWGKSESLIPPKEVSIQIINDPFQKEAKKANLKMMLYARPPVKYALDESLKIPEDEVEYFSIMAIDDSAGLSIETYFGVTLEKKHFDVINMNV